MAEYNKEPEHTARKAHPIDAIDVIKNQIAELHDICERLTNLLSPVLNRPQDVDTVTSDPELHDAVARSPVMEDLEVVQFNLSGLGQKLKRLIERLDL